jgi:hypothetical protein
MEIANVMEWRVKLAGPDAGGLVENEHDVFLVSASGDLWPVAALREFASRYHESVPVVVDSLSEIGTMRNWHFDEETMSLCATFTPLAPMYQEQLEDAAVSGRLGEIGLNLNADVDFERTSEGNLVTRLRGVQSVDLVQPPDVPALGGGFLPLTEAESSQVIARVLARPDPELTSAKAHALQAFLESQGAQTPRRSVSSRRQPVRICDYAGGVFNRLIK